MISEKDLGKVKNATKEFFEKAGFDAEISVKISSDSQEVIDIDLEIDEPQILIGEKGQTLSEIQRLLRIILRKKIETPFFINLDISGYKKKKIEYLKELANSTANDVALSKEQKELSPMLAFERRIIHLELAERSDVATDSVGEDEERRVVIKPS